MRPTIPSPASPREQQGSPHHKPVLFFLISLCALTVLPHALTVRAFRGSRRYFWRKASSRSRYASNIFSAATIFLSLVDEPTNQATSNVEWVWLQGRSREVLPRLGSVHHLHVRPRSKEGGEEGDSFFFCSRHDSFIHPRPLSHPYLCPAPLSGRLPATPKRATTCGLTTWSACTTRRRCVF